MSRFLNRVARKVLTSLADREKLIFLLSNKTEKELLGFKSSGYLYDIGWTNSITSGDIVDQSNKPIPWVTYPFMQFIEKRLNKSLEIFEFGCGNSTLYYADKAAFVTTVEHDPTWFDTIKSSMPENVKLSFCKLVYGGDYCNYAATSNKIYDIIIVDGRDRVNCCINAVAALKPAGVIVLDDSERKQYLPAHSFLNENGFKKLDFWGIAPAVNYLKCTTIFYRDTNCLQL